MATKKSNSRTKVSSSPASKFLLSGLGDAKHTKALHQNLKRYREKILPKLKPQNLELPGQPLDRFYLSQSRLFRLSRERFLKSGGSFRPTLVSSERSLSSENLLGSLIEYTPHEDELFFRALEGDLKIADFTRFSVSSYHEQNHRIFWKELPIPVELNADSLRRYLNLMESLVVMLDMALGDEIGTELSAPGYQVGVIYDPGTEVEFANERELFNYYHCACHTTFLALEGYSLKKIREFIPARHGGALKKALLSRAMERSLRLDVLFVELTNPTWQEKHREELLKFFGTYSTGRRTLQLAEDPAEFVGEYLLVERVLRGFLSGGDL